MISSPIFRRDSQGNVRFWSYEISGNRYRTHSGRHGGAVVSSGWISCVATSQPTGEDQAQFEAAAMETKNLSGQYASSLEDIDLPKSFMPMLAKVYDGDIFFPAISQPKLDGIRCIATAQGLFTRQGNAIFSTPHIAAALTSFFETHPDAILDGELYNHDLKDDFNQIAAIVRHKKCSVQDLAKSAELIQFHIYDCFDATMDWHARMRDTQNLRRQCERHSGSPIRFVESTSVPSQQELDQSYDRYLTAGYEGQMIRLPGPYEQKRSALLLKRKAFQDQEFTIVDIKSGRGKLAGCAKKVILRLADGRKFGANIQGDRHFVGQLLVTAHHHVGRAATVKFYGYTPAGIPRFPIVTKFEHQ